MARQKKQVVYGIHAVRHILEQSPESVTELWFKEDKRLSQELENLRRLASKNTIAIQRVNIKALEDKASSKQHQGVILVRKQQAIKNEKDLKCWLDAHKEKNKLFLVLDNVQDPHNLGACLRTADAVGVDGVIVSKDNSVRLTPVVIKVASGAADSVSFYTVTNLARTLRELKEQNIWLMGADGEAAQTLYEMDFTVSTALVLGSEGKGLRDSTRKQCDQLISIPMQGQVESLNVSVASGICLFEVLRQRRLK